MALLKMTMLAFKSFERPADLMKPRMFTAMFNPASYKLEYNLTKDKKEATGDTAQNTPVTAVSLKKMAFDFLVDGTGANGDNRVVLQETKKFETMVMPEKKDMLAFNAAQADAHLKLPKLLLLWGTFLFPCEIESFSVNYTLFSQLGIPLRATISAAFNEVIPGTELDVLNTFAGMEGLETVTNVASFLSSAFSATNNVARAVGMAREENLNSIRQNISLR